MASIITTQADAIRSAVAAIHTCTPAISATLKELLQGSEAQIEGAKPTTTAKAKLTRTTTKTKTTSTKRAQAAAAQAVQQDGARDGGLSSKEKALLATQVINATLKSLGEAAKNPSARATTQPPTNGKVSKSRGTLRRSNSVPMTPLQPRSLNRVSTSPMTARIARSPTGSTASSGCLATVECARAAFATLRALSNAGKVVLPELQLESGMSSFISKLIALDLYEHALKELRLLKRRLEVVANGTTGKKPKLAATAEPASAAKTFSDLFDYPTVSVGGPVLALIITSQLQGLRVLYGLKKASHLEAALPFLLASYQSSPLSLLLQSLEDAKPDRTKCARQLESLAQSLLALTPSVSSKDDGVAIEPRINPSPEATIQIQALALETRVHAWALTGHKGDIDKDIMLPFSKCLSAYSRRSFSGASAKAETLNHAFTQICQRLQVIGSKPSETPRSPLAEIYQVLGTASREAGNIEEALTWMKKLKALTTMQGDSPARCCSVTAQLIMLQLKLSASMVDENLLLEVLEGLQGPLSGNSTDLDDLLVSICLMRRAAIHLVLSEKQFGDDMTRVRELLESILLQLPRFTSRWLGKAPVPDSTTKDLLRFEQRRQLLARYIHSIIDSALMLVKYMLDTNRVEWETMDPVLQDTLVVLENMGDLALPATKSNPAASYYVKISHFYYLQHVALRQDAKVKDSQSLRALRRSIDAVKQRPEAEQLKAQLLAKRERLVELCRSSGRRDDASDTLRSIRDSLVREGAVTEITEALSRQSVLQAWAANAKASSLSRTVCSLTKIDNGPSDWTWLLTGAEKATALEHDLYFVYSADAKSRKQLVPGQEFVKKMLAAFDPLERPVRRLRTLLQFLVVGLDNREDTTVWIEEVQSLSNSIDTENLAEDCNLVHYLPHLQALTTCVIALAHGEPDTPAIKQSLEMWHNVAGDCETTGELYKHIDNTLQLTTTLQGLADLAKMKGLNTLLGSVLSLLVLISSKMGDSCSPELSIQQNGALCLQHMTLGRSTKAEEILEVSRKLVTQEAVSPDTLAYFHLCSAEYEMAVGNFDQAERCLVEAHASATSQSHDKHPKSSRLARKLSIAHASFLHSVLALERGQSHHALQHAKNAVRILFHDWVKLDALRGAVPDQDDISQAELTEDDSSFSSRCSQSETTRANTGPEFWAMVYPLFRFVMRLSSVYAHVGMYQETMYYAEQAQKIATSTESSSHVMQSKYWLASVLMTAGKPQAALEIANEVKNSLPNVEPTCLVVDIVCQLSRMYRDVSDHDTEMHLMCLAESMLQKLTEGGLEAGGSGLEATMERLTIKEKAVPKVTTRQIKARPGTTTRKAATRKPLPLRAKTPVEVKAPVAAEDTQLAFLQASVLQYKSSSLLDSKDWTAAVTALQAAYTLSKLSNDITQERLLMAIALIGQSMDQMGKDSVFSVIQDSTLSFPAIAGASKDKSDRTAMVKSTPPRKARAGADLPVFLSNLQQAQDYLLEAHSLASLNGNARLVYRIAALLQNVFILLSTTSPSKSSGIGHPAHATCSIELARNLVWRRERKTLRLDLDKSEKAEWPVLKQVVDSRRSSLGFSIDMNRFQREYVDIIPKSWNVVSISLSDNKHDLCITKLQADHSPFAIRLPLERASSRDADTEVFNFRQGRAEMTDIIQVANRTCHDARDMNQKGAKSAWWAEREAIDERMKDLLENIEHTWLGGFRGIFGQHHRRSDLLARFQKSFQNILDKHLSSRQQVRGKRSKAATTNKVSLDPRILDLFIGLGDATLPDCDLDEPLTDLLYFVVDILQFHGERNAYDEIDFDSMVVETFDALHSYHAAAKASSHDNDNVHTILVLDKTLHIFPWESLPCMQGLAVSRIPSLACLRRSILEQRPSPVQRFTNEEDGTHRQGAKDGHHIALHSGAYILNPGADLKSTEATFAKPLAALPPTWSSIETRIPTETEFEQSLTQSDLLLYFGHGSGAQYIRGRTIRKLEKCRAVALLMGCSSASLADVGDFESHGPVWNYMLAGSPAVVGTLWDVTDRDIDRYAGKVFEEWGLMPKGTFAEDGPNVKGKGKASSARGKKKIAKEAEEDERGSETSLVEAVAKARDACRFRYLTAAAVVVYGIPVYISK